MKSKRVSCQNFSKKFILLLSFAIATSALAAQEGWMFDKFSRGKALRGMEMFPFDSTSSLYNNLKASILIKRICSRDYDVFHVVLSKIPKFKTFFGVVENSSIEWDGVYGRHSILVDSENQGLSFIADSPLIKNALKSKEMVLKLGTKDGHKTIFKFPLAKFKDYYSQLVQKCQDEYENYLD